MKKLLTFLTMFTLFFGVGWAASKTITADEVQGTMSGTTNLSYTSGDITILVSSGTFANESDIRVYKGGTLTVTSSNGNITSIELTMTGSSYVNATVNSGTYTTNDKSGIWTGDASSVVFTAPSGNSGNQLRIASLTVTYEGTTPSSYSLTLPNNLTGGTVTATGADDLTAIEPGTELTVTAVPDEANGYQLEWMKANGVEVENPYTFEISENTVITASFVKPNLPESGTMTFVQTSATAGTLTGAPTGVTATFNNTYTSNKEQLTAGNTMTLTISGMPASKQYKITGVRLEVHNNKSSGAGVATVKMNDTQIGSLDITGLGTTYQLKDVAITQCPFSGDLIITITASANSVFCDKFEIDYNTSYITVVEPPVISGETPFVGSTQVTITAEEGATIRYTTDGTDPDNSSTEYTAPITLTQSATVKARAYVGEVPSTIASKEFVKTTSAATVAEIVALADNTEFVFTGDLVVSAQGITNNNKYLYAQDETGGMLLYNPTQDYVMGDLIPSGFSAKKTTYKGAPELQNFANLNPAVTHDQSLEAESITPNQISASGDDYNVFEYSVIENARITQSDNKYYINVTVGETVETVEIYDRFGVAVPEHYSNKFFKVYGVSGWYNDKQFMPLEFIESIPETAPDGYYLVGEMNSWAINTAYLFTPNSDGSYYLNHVVLENGDEFKIRKVEGGVATTWYGAYDNYDSYGITGGSHTDKPMNGGHNYKLPSGGDYYFAISSDMKLSVDKAPVVLHIDYTGDDNTWVDEQMTFKQDASGWTITKELAVGAHFGFNDGWGVWHGSPNQNDSWSIGENSNLNTDINMWTDGKFFSIATAGEYTFSLNRAATVANISLAPVTSAITCTPNPNAGGTVKAQVDGQNVTSALSGTTVTLVITTKNGYEFNNVTLNGEELQAVEGVYSFTMPRTAVEVVANYTANSYPITVVSPHGTTTCPENATTGQTVSFTVTPNSGFTVDGVTASFVNAGGGTTALTVTESDGTYSFGMAPFDVTVTVNYSSNAQQVTLADWLAAQPGTYNVTDLRCVKVIDNQLLCKDVDGAAQQAPTNNTWIDFMATYKPNGGDAVGAYTTYDHSNWILLSFTTDVVNTNNLDQVSETIAALAGKKLKNAVVNADGKLTVIPDYDVPYTYTPNTYIPAAFTGSNPVAATWYESWGVPPTQHENHQDCFFVQPKSLELVSIVNAEWNGSKFVTHPITIRVPKEDGEGYTYNELNFLGSINLPANYATASLESGTVYEFEGYVQMLSKNRDISYTITPTTDISASGVVTAIEDLNMTVNGEVESVTYYSISGMKGSKPFDGINIVVTRYTDGHISTSKVIK